MKTSTVLSAIVFSMAVTVCAPAAQAEGYL